MDRRSLFFGLLLVGSCQKINRVEAAVWEPQKHTWMVDPVVEVCYSAPVTLGEVQWALDKWAEHGAPKLTAIESHCYSKTEDHTVYVDAPTPEEYAKLWNGRTVGLTGVFFFDNTRVAGVADVHLISDDRRVLLHEVGHIWFPNHYPGEDHVMSEWLSDFAWEGWEGVEKAFRGR